MNVNDTAFHELQPIYQLYDFFFFDHGLLDCARSRTFALIGARVQETLDLPWVPILIGALFVFHSALGWFTVTGGS